MLYILEIAELCFAATHRTENGTQGKEVTEAVVMELGDIDALGEGLPVGAVAADEDVEGGCMVEQTDTEGAAKDVGCCWRQCCSYP